MLKIINRGTLFYTLENQFKQIKFYIYLLFAIIFALISIPNLYNFHAHAYDLGIYNNSIYQYSHFINNPHPYGHANVTNFLGDHFALYTIIFSPLYYVFGLYTLLIVQIAAILFGGYGIYKLIKLLHPSTMLPEVALFHFFSFYGLYSALGFGYHDNVVATMLIPWFIYYLYLDNFKNLTIVTIFICIGKENMPLILAFVIIGYILIFKNDFKKVKILTALLLFCVVYMLIVIKLVMPIFLKDNNSGNHLSYYGILGSGPKEIIENLLFKSKYYLTTLFTNHSGNPNNDWCKQETYVCLFVSGGLALLIKPEFLVMIIPIIFQKMYNIDQGKWGIDFHYSIEFAPIIVISVYTSLLYISSLRLKLRLAAFAGFLSYSTSFLNMFQRNGELYYNLNVNILIKPHFKSEFNRGSFEKLTKMIPKNARLSTNSCFGANLAFRKWIFLIPDVSEANYVFVGATGNDWPLSKTQLEEYIEELKKSRDWILVAEESSMFLFKRRS